MDQTPPFRVELLRPFDHLAVVELEGDVDIHSASRFKGVVAQALDEGASRIIIDLAKVSFIDSTALGVVVGGLKGVKAHGGSLDVVCPDESMRDIFTATGLDQVLGIYGSRTQALAAPVGREP